jgi:predicted branched-subunit amino acid permease
MEPPDALCRTHATGNASHHHALTPSPPSSASPYASPAAALRGGMRDALAAPAVVLGASYVGFGSLLREVGLSLGVGLWSTASTWALPGQVALIELYGIGASVVAILAAVALTGVRLLPMTMALLPVLWRPGVARWRLYLAAHFIAVTAWAMAMRRCPELPPDQRLRYFAGVAGTLWLASMAGTTAGFVLAQSLPASVGLGLVFLNPLYFLLVFVGDLRHRDRMLALALGGLIGPPLQALSPGWGLLVAGLAAGTLAVALDRWLAARAKGARRG